MSDSLELPANVGSAIGRLLAGVPLAAAGVLLLRPGPAEAVAGMFLLVVGLPLVLNGANVLLRRPPRLHASHEGVWFGGGSVVPWTAIKQIYAASVDVQYSYVRAKTQSIAFDFHRRRTMLRLPPAAWFASVLSVGDYDVSAGSERASVLAARLEAMRAAACGHEDGVVAGTTELPRARIIE